MEATIKKIRLPKNTIIGKFETNYLSLAGNHVNGGREQVYLKCTSMFDGCHDSISIFPLISCNDWHKLTDLKASKIFESYGWSIFGFNGSKRTTCPNCKNS